MGALSLRERLERQVDTWGYNFAQFEIFHFIGWVEKRRARPVRLVPVRLPREIFGAWIEGDTADYIFYEDEPIHVHTIHILLHELCHMLLGHTTVHIGNDLARQLGSAHRAGGETESAMAGLLRQVNRSGEQELEAETLSSLIQNRVFRQAGLAALSHTSQGPAMQHFMQGIGMDEAP